MRQEGREISKWGWEDRKVEILFFFILPHREMRELILRGLHLFFSLPLHLFRYFTTFAFWHALCCLILIFQSFSQNVFLCCHSHICNFQSPLCRSFWIWTVPNSFLFPSPIPPCRLYGFVIHGNLTANIYLFSLCPLPFTFLIFCLFPSRMPQQVVYIYTHEWNAWRGEWFKDLKGGKSNEKSGFRFKHFWWALITKPLWKKI